MQDYLDELKEIYNLWLVRPRGPRHGARWSPVMFKLDLKKALAIDIYIYMCVYIDIDIIYIYTRQLLLPSNGSHLDPKCQTVTYKINHA